MVELESEGELTRSEVAVFLREFADELEDGGFDRDRDPISDANEEEITDEGLRDPKRITFIVGGDSATVTLPNTVDFDVEVESRSPMFGSSVNQAIDLELSWEYEEPDHYEEELEIK